MILYIFVLLFVYVVLFYRNVRRYPKGPLPLPLVGNLYHLSAEFLHEKVHELGKEYDGCFTLFLPRPIVFFTTFETVKESLITQAEIFAGRSHLPPETLLQMYEQTGVLISDGDVWRAQRRTSLRIMRELGLGRNLMEQQVNRSIDEMMKQLKEKNDGITPFDMCMPIQLCIGNVMNETLFGYHFEYEDTKRFDLFNKIIAKHLRTVKDNFYVLMVQAWPWAKNLPIIGERGFKQPFQNVTMYHKFIEEEVNKIRKSFHLDHEPTNFVEAYLAEMQNNKELDLENLHAIGVDFWMAGMETTSTSLKWFLLHLMKNPHEQEKIRSELQSVVGRDRRLQISDKPKLPYFVAAMAELHRVANMISFVFFHRCTEDTMIGDKFIPKDTLTFPQLFSVLKDDPVFEKPEEFRPSRFLEEDGKTVNRKVMERMIIFGLGKRQCVGEGLAKSEIFLVLGTLLLNYRFEPIEPIDMNPIFGSILNPRPYKCRVVPI
ncbi:hypothetical protein PMAYCL1PPCAC_18050, partial [Pristionchus mayeri]